MNFYHIWQTDHVMIQSLIISECIENWKIFARRTGCVPRDTRWTQSYSYADCWNLFTWEKCGYVYNIAVRWVLNKLVVYFRCIQGCLSLVICLHFLCNYNLHSLCKLCCYVYWESLLSPRKFLPTLKTNIFSWCL